MTISRDFNGVRSPNDAYTEMLERWRLIYDLWGGTKTMREANTRWLPRNPLESEEHYRARLNRTFLYNAFRRTIKSTIGQMFMHPITIANLPEELEYLNRNADGGGQSITAVAATLCEHLLLTGKAHPFVDFPVTGGQVSVGDVRRGEKLPVVNTIDPRDLIGWRSHFENSREVIDEIRFVERSLEVVDFYHDVETEKVRVIKPDSFQVYGQIINSGAVTTDFDFEEEGTNTLGYVPIVPIYEEKLGTFVAEPPLEDLAWLNLRHWQSTSEQNNILHVVRVPILFGKKVDMESMEIGANSAIFVDDAEAELSYVEHSGNAIDAARQDLQDLEEQMSKMGSDILTSKSVARQTASAREIDKAESLSTGQVIIRNLERGIEEVIRICGEWINVDANDVRVHIGEDMSIGAEANPIDDLLKLGLTDDDLLEEAKRRGILGQGVEKVSVPKGSETNVNPFEKQNEETDESENEEGEDSEN